MFDEGKMMAKKKAIKPRQTRRPVRAVVRVPKKSQWWTVVWSPSMTPIVPYDSNPVSADEGLLVYRSKTAAKHSANHQQEMYGDDQEAIAVPLDSVK